MHVRFKKLSPAVASAVLAALSTHAPGQSYSISNNAPLPYSGTDLVGTAASDQVK